MKRDIHGIIVQDDPGNPNYEDGGDSAFSTGLMAFCGSHTDLYLMNLFIDDNLKLMRHPFQTTNTGDAPHNDSSATSRDQVIAFYAGLYTAITEADITLPTEIWSVLQDSCLGYAKSWSVNRDVLLFANKFYLYKCAHVKPPLWLYPLAYLNQLLNLWWDTKVKPEKEKNQAVCMNIIFGQWWITKLREWHPGLDANIRDYFYGWRRRGEIADALYKKILEEVYPSRKPENWVIKK